MWCFEELETRQLCESVSAQKQIAVQAIRLPLLELYGAIWVTLIKRVYRALLRVQCYNRLR